MRILDSIRMASRLLIFTLGLALFAGCAAMEADLIDGENDSFLGGTGKADANGIEEGSHEARGVLRVANEASVEVLDNSPRQGGVGLDRRAAENIVAYRLGDDGIGGTSDDEQFDTLAELDAVPYVGPVAFDKLLAYADVNGYTADEDPVVTSDPFDPNSCTGTPMTREEALAFFQPGATQAVIGEYVIQRRSRSCNSVTRCGSWGEPTTHLGYYLHSGGTISTISRDVEMRGDVVLEVDRGDIVLRLKHRSHDRVGSRCSAVGSDIQGCSSYVYISGYQWGGGGGENPTYTSVNTADPNDDRLELSGLLTTSCLRLTDKARSASVEEEYVLLSRLTAGAPPPPMECPSSDQTLMECGSQAPGATTCCQRGMRTCPQSGCDCWSSCS